MSVRLKAIYRGGAFVPMSNGDEVNMPENTEVELTVHDPYLLPATATTAEERGRALKDLVESWKDHPLSANAPRLTRDELHERR